MQSEPLSSSKLSQKPFIFYFLNTLVLFLIIYVQFQNIIGVPLKETMPQFSKMVFLLDKVPIFFLFMVCNAPH